MKRLLITLLGLAACIYADAREVNGRVISGKEKLGGVIVTDGENFTQTRKYFSYSSCLKHIYNES